jgi:hypothetical protein
MAAGFVQALGGAGDPRAKEMMSIVSGKVIQAGGAAAAEAWAAALPAGDLRGNALWEVSRAAVRENPKAAMAWAASLTAGDPNAANITQGIAMELGRRDGRAAVEWLGSLGNNAAAPAAYGPAVGGWAKSDPLAASQFVSAMPPSESRDHAIGGLVYTYRWEDPAGAIAWANAVGSSHGRESALTLAAEAYVKKDPPGAAAWLPSSGLPPATQQRLLGK